MNLKLTPLNLPEFNPKTKTEQHTHYVFDVYRKKWVKLTPEEWVRQSFLNYLVRHLNYPKGRLGVEFQVMYDGLSRRVDAVVFDEYAKPLVIVECKAPHVKLTQDVFFQACMYNKQLQAKHFILTNGLQHIFSTLNKELNKMVFLENVPNFQEL